MAPSVQGRTSGLRGHLTYVSITKCAISADQCAYRSGRTFICGHRGADVRPDFDWERSSAEGR